MNRSFLRAHLSKFVNFAQEIELFNGMIEKKVTQRVFMIEGIGGTGKSWLLRKMHDICIEKQIPSVLIDFKDQTYNHPHYYLANLILGEFGIAKIGIDLPLGSSGENSTGIRIDRESIIRGNIEKIAGHNYYERSNVSISSNYYISDLSRFLSINDNKTNLIKRFIENMDTFTREKNVVVCFFDTIENIPNEVEQWLTKAFFNPIFGRQFNNLLIVTAGKRKIVLKDDYLWEINGLAYFHHLRYFTINDFVEYGSKIGVEISKEEAKKKWEMCRGLPLYLEMLFKK